MTVKPTKPKKSEKSEEITKPTIALPKASPPLMTEARKVTPIAICAACGNPRAGVCGVCGN